MVKRLRLWTCGVIAGALQAAGCAGAPLRLWPQDCPREALNAMHEIGVEPVGGWFRDIYVNVDARNPGYQNEFGTYRQGPIVSSTRSERPAMPPGTLLYGYMWTETNRVHVHYNRAILPDGREYPVCYVLGFDEEGGVPKESGKEPGTVILSRSHSVVATRRFIRPD